MTEVKERYPLHSAVATNDLVKLRQLLASGENVDERGGVGDTPLILAAKKGRMEAVKILVDAGADVNAIDNYKQSTLYYAVTKYHISAPSNRNDDYSDMAALLIKKGAQNSPIRVDPEFFVKALRTLTVRHEDIAESFIKKEFHREMFHTDSKYIEKQVNDFLSAKDPKESLNKALENLININFQYENRFEAITHLSHLNSWTGEVVDYDYQVEAEGWLMHRYPPLKVKNLLTSLKDINDGKVDTNLLFNEPKDRIISKIVSEIGAQLTTYYTQVNQDTIKMLDNPKMKEIALNEEVKMVCERVTKLKPGKEFAIASGFPGHAIYIGFKKSLDNTVSRRIYNLGGGIKDNHVFSETGRVFPDVINKIPVSVFQSSEAQGAKYIKGVIEAKLGIHEKYLPFIYDNAENLGGNRVTQNFQEPQQKRQLAGNCVLKNNNAAIRNRLSNDNLFKWLKNEEIKVAEQVADIGSMEFGSKEVAKDILSLKYVVNEHNRSKNRDGAVINFNLFFRKRLPISQKNHTNPKNELADFVKTNKDNVKFKKWMSIDSVKKLLDNVMGEKSLVRS